MRSKHPIDFPHLVLLLAKWIPLSIKGVRICSISCRRRINHRLAYGNIDTNATQCTTLDMKGTEFAFLLFAIGCHLQQRHPLAIYLTLPAVKSFWHVQTSIAIPFVRCQGRWSQSTKSESLRIRADYIVSMAQWARKSNWLVQLQFAEGLENFLTSCYYCGGSAKIIHNTWKAPNFPCFFSLEFVVGKVENLTIYLQHRSTVFPAFLSFKRGTKKLTYFSVR